MNTTRRGFIAALFAPALAPLAASGNEAPFTCAFGGAVAEWKLVRHKDLVREFGKVPDFTVNYPCLLNDLPLAPTRIRDLLGP